MTSSFLRLRAYNAADEDAVIELWRRAWQRAYPRLDFTARVDWWRKRWRGEIVPKATILIAQGRDGIVGFITVDRDGYLDQIVVAPESWGRGIGERLLAQAKRLAPTALELHVNQDNARALRFYQKHGFIIVGEDINPRSRAPVYRMRWQA